jgi:protein-disulfide isomerase
MRFVAILTALLAVGSSPSAPAVSSSKASGNPAAPIRIEVFSDFQCPACKTLYEETLRPLMRDYVASGKVYLIHRYFPLAMHPVGLPAAIYACAAERIGKYEEVATALFRDQVALSLSGNVDQSASSVLTAAEAKQVRALVRDPSVAAEVQADYALGEKVPIRQTPTMIITHRLKQYPVTGYVNYDLVRRLLDGLLEK